jgi:hypothetical protein
MRRHRAGNDRVSFRVLSAALLHTCAVTEPGGRDAHPAGTGQVTRQRSSRRLLGVEANARLTSFTGLVLLVMLAAEGLTILSIHRLLTWHAAIGLALVPVVAVKLGSTMWRFGRYYWGDVRYRAAGPPHPLLRILGPVVVLTTAAVLATGIAAWVVGPHHGPWVTLHKASFILWFGVMAIHVLAYTPRALRLARADLEQRPRVPHRLQRLGLVAVSVCAGIALGLAAGGLSGGWTAFIHRFH